jgi:hypothetical protein
MTRPVESPHVHHLPSPVGSVETQPGYHLAALTAFRIGDVPIMVARNKDSKTFQPQRRGLISITVIAPGPGTFRARISTPVTGGTVTVLAVRPEEQRGWSRRPSNSPLHSR